jgi:hypothetical protein
MAPFPRLIFTRDACEEFFPPYSSCYFFAYSLVGFSYRSMNTNSLVGMSLLPRPSFSIFGC